MGPNAAAKDDDDQGTNARIRFGVLNKHCTRDVAEWLAPPFDEQTIIIGYIHTYMYAGYRTTDKVVTEFYIHTETCTIYIHQEAINICAQFVLLLCISTAPTVRSNGPAMSLTHPT
jgi:hypothetical protein